MSAAIQLDHLAINTICLRHSVQTLSLFGSAIHGTFGPDSDLDFLVQFLPGHQPGHFKLAALQLDLEQALGRRVDLKTAAELSQYFREQVIQEAVVQYAA